MSKDLRRRNKKLQFELRTLRADLEKEMGLLKRIERHRGLSSDEKYFKAKVEKYLNLTKSSYQVLEVKEAVFFLEEGSNLNWSISKTVGYLL